MSAKSALGRGLGSLIPPSKSNPSPAPLTTTEQVIPEARQEVLEVAVVKIKENPRQPRRTFASEELEDLRNSIQEHGIIQPLVVTRSGNGYELIAGERRFRASKSLGLEKVPVVVRKATDQQKLEWALIENIQRQDLNPVEEALAYRALMEDFDLIQQEVAKRVGKSRPVVANTMRLLELPDHMLAALSEGRLTKSHARTLLGESDELRREDLFQAMLRGEMTVREAEQELGESPSRAGKATRAKDPNIQAHEKRLREILGTKVSIKERHGRGKITINFYSKEELLELLETIAGF